MWWEAILWRRRNHGRLDYEPPPPPLSADYTGRTTWGSQLRTPCMSWGALDERMSVHHGDTSWRLYRRIEQSPSENSIHAMLNVMFAKRMGCGYEQAVEFLHRCVGWRDQAFKWEPNIHDVRDVAKGFG